MESSEKNVSFLSGNITVKGCLSYKSPEDITFTVKEPENISDTVFTFDEISSGDVKISYGKAGDRSPVRLLLSVVSDIASKEISLPLKGEYKYESAVSSAEYKILFDCEKREITAIEADKYKFEFQ